MGSVAKVRRNINPGLKIDGILLTMVDDRTNNAKSIISSLLEIGGLALLKEHGLYRSNSGPRIPEFVIGGQRPEH